MAMADGGDGDTAVALDALADGVMEAMAPVHGLRRLGRRGQVLRALRMRAEGVSFAAIARAVGVDPRTVRGWCGKAAQLDPGFDPSRQRRESPVSFRPSAGMTEALESRAYREGIPVPDLLRRLVVAGLGEDLLPVQVPQGPTVAVLDPAVLDVLISVRDALSEQQLEASAQGNNANQLARFVNTYRELPTSITGTLAAFTEAIAVWREALDRMATAVEAVAG